MSNRHRILAVAAVGLCAALWTYACGEGATEPSVPPPGPDPPRPATVAVAPATVQLMALGSTQQLTAEVRDQNGRAMAGAAVAWSSGDASVATVDVSGIATAAGNGTATITATAGSASGSASVTVAQAVRTVSVSPSADTLVAGGDTLRLAAAALDANGHAVADAEFEWASGDTAVATVDATGLATGIGPGEVEITASSSGVAGRASLTVVAPEPTTIGIAPDTLALTALGQTGQLSAEVRDQVGRVMEGVPVSWSSADTTVAAVDSAGVVTAVGGGASTVTASAGEASGEALVTVMQSAGSVAVTPAAGTVAPGDTLRLVANAFDSNGHAIAVAEFEWSSSDVSVATVDESGLVRGQAEGTATIAAASGDARGTADVTVENPDRAALVALYHATDGPNWVDNTNWLTDAPLGEWYGVDADASGRVVGLDLSGRWDNDAQETIDHGLTGSIPAELGNLADLRDLWLSSNALTGPVPPELGNLGDLRSLVLSDNALTGSIPAELGNLADLQELWLSSNAFTGPVPAALGKLGHLHWLDLSGNELAGPVPAELGNLADLRGLWLSSNALTGPIPAELGNLTSLTSLRLSSNALTGPVPSTFLRLDRLSVFIIGGNETLCVPGRSAFVAWMREIEHRGADWESLFCNAADAAALGQLYELAGGAGWSRSDGWAGDGALEARHGVSADSLGRVTALDLTANGLAGRLPPTLGELARMTELRIADNPGLSGRLPLSLANLSLRTLHYDMTDLCYPAETSFRDWLNTIASHEGTGAECEPPMDRKVLEVLYGATGGPQWINSENWLTDAPLGEWHGVDVDGEGRVQVLGLFGNNLSGPIPAELGSLTGLRELYLRDNALTGPIPAELGSLTSLRRLYLSENNLSGPIPVELGGLTSLRRLYLSENNLSGPIPVELGHLANLERLRLEDNALTGPIPPELGGLANLWLLYVQSNNLSGPIPVELESLTNLRYVDLSENALTGPIPPQLGSLRLRALYVANNALSGPLPPEFGSMTGLRELGLTNNRGLEGVLPSGLAELDPFEVLLVGGTGLCAPSDPRFQAWLDGVHKRRVGLCEAGQPPMAYLAQAVQSREFPVPLVAGRAALLRVFPIAQRATGAGIPAVRARFFVGGREVHVEDLPGKSDPIPDAVDESSLSKSANAEIPAEVIQPGLEMVIEVDPDGALDPALGVATRIPESGRMAVDVRAMPLFDLTLIPFIWSETRDSLIVGLVEAMAADPENHEMFSDTRALLPVGDLVVTAHEPVLSTSNNAFTLLYQTAAIQAMEGGTGHWKGMMNWPITGAGGVAWVPGRSSFSQPSHSTVAHELGHNMNLHHAPCGGPRRADPSFPYSDGTAGVWGYDSRDGGGLVRPSIPDLMSYCGPPDGVSDYHFSNALRYRLFDEGPLAATVAARTRSLLLWGGIDADGVPFMEPAFLIDAPAALPDSAGVYEIAGRSAAGAQLFSLSFTMPETADGDGSSGFVFALPVQPGWAGSLASITLTGPGGAVVLDADTDRPMAILRDPRNGQVRAILRDVPDPARARADAAVALGAGPGLEVLFSRGIPGQAAWRP